MGMGEGIIRRDYPRSSTVLFFLLALTVAVLFLRRPDQFLAPYIWVEDGRFILREYLEQDWRTILNPLAGYLVVATKIISYLSFKASILYAPEVEVVLTVLLTFGVVCAIAFSPTHLRYPALCAMSVLLIPTDAETFAVSLYSFWWAGILYLLAVIWDEERGKIWLRYAFIVFGGLSSPLAVTLAPLFILRAAVERRGWGAAAIAVVVAGLQIEAMIQQRVDASISTVNVQTAIDALRQLVGNFLFQGAGLLGGIFLLALYGGAIARNRRRFGWPFWLLVTVNIVICASVALRLNEHLATINQFIAGPRYFFYPFIVLGWLLIWVAAESNGIVRAITVCIFAVSIVTAGTELSRRHDHISWRDEILKCANSETYKIPLHFIGETKNMWDVEFKGAECREMIRRSLF
jgi:hypothetical protein